MNFRKFFKSFRSFFTDLFQGTASSESYFWYWKEIFGGNKKKNEFKKIFYVIENNLVGAAELLPSINFVSATKIEENTTNILNC